MIGFDHYAIRNIRAVRDRQDNPPPNSQSLLSFLSPWSAFQTRYSSEEQLKKIFLRAAKKMADRLPKLIDEASKVHYLLQSISSVLNHIKGLTLEELKGTPEMSVLASIWDKLAQPEDLSKRKSYRASLNGITTDYAGSTDCLIDALFTMNKMRSDMIRLQDLSQLPASAWSDIPLELTIDMMSQAMKRLEVARRRMDKLEPDAGSPPARTVHATMAA
jgi:hypothetical protein